MIKNLVNIRNNSNAHMLPKLLLLGALALISADQPANAKKISGSKGKTHASAHLSHPSSIARDRKGRIARSSRTKNEFKRSTPCPANGRSSGACPGYVVDHKVPLKRGGPDSPANMQWQTIGEAKAKDRWE